MDILLSIAMFIVPPLFALVIHNYLRHGEMGGHRKAIFGVSYLIIINLITYMVCCLRGVASLNFENMTITFKAKYLGLGCVLAIVIPFIVCLITEDQITLGGLNRYITRFVKDLKKYIPYAVRSAKADLRSEVANAYLDWLWWLIEPVCMMLIYAVIFGAVFKASEPYYTVFIFIGITLWGFFSRNISASVNMVRANKGIITKIYMPKYILYFSKMLVNGFKMLVSMAVILVMMICYRVPPTINILYAVLTLIPFFLFTFGLGTILMHYGVYVNDLGYITGIVLNMLMYLSGTFYSIGTRFPEPYGGIVLQFNPVAFFIATIRDGLLYGISPDWILLGIWSFVSVILIALGVFTIYSNENAYVKVI